MPAITDQVKHEYETEEEFEKKYGKTDNLEQVINLLCLLKCKDDIRMYCREGIEVYPEEESVLLNMFGLDREDVFQTET